LKSFNKAVWLEVLLLAGSIAITYEEQDEVLKKGHRNGTHKYKTNFQAGGIIYSKTP
jgi:hypothetical protein